MGAYCFLFLRSICFYVVSSSACIHSIIFLPHLDLFRVLWPCQFLEGDRKLLDNFSHESDVTSLQDPFTSRPYKTPFFFYYWVPRKIQRGILFQLHVEYSPSSRLLVSALAVYATAFKPMFSSLPSPHPPTISLPPSHTFFQLPIASPIKYCILNPTPPPPKFSSPPPQTTILCPAHLHAA